MTTPRFRFGLVRSIGAVLLQQGSMFLISLLTFSVLMRVLGIYAEGIGLDPGLYAGLYALLILALNVVLYAGNTGLKKIMVRMISGSKLERDDGRKSVFWTSFWIGLVPIAIFSGIAVMILSYFHLLDTPRSMLDTNLLFFVLLLASTRYLAGGGLEGLKRFEILSVYVTGAFTLRRLLAIALVPFWGITGLLLGWLVGEGTGLVLVIIEDLKEFGLPRLPESPTGILRQALPLSVSDIADTITTWGDRVAALAIYPTLAFLGFFHVAATGAMMLDTASTAIYTGSLPHLSEAFKEGGGRELAKKVKEIGRYVMLFGAPIGIGGAVLAYPLVTLLAGPAFAEAVPIFAIMGIGMWISALGRLFQSSLIAAGLTKEVMYATAIGTVIDFLVMTSLAGQLGVLAMGVARASLFISSFLLSAYFMDQRIGIETDRTAVWKAYLSSMIMGLVVYLLYTFVSSVRTLHVFIALPLYIVVGIVTYVLGLRLLKAANVDEVAMLYNSIPAKSRWIIKLITSVMGLEFSQVERKVEELNHS